MGKREQVTVRDLREEYGAYAPFILETSGFIKSLPRKPRKYRRYKVLRDLPTYEDYQRMSRLKFRYELNEFFLFICTEMRMVLSESLSIEDKAIDWMYPVHRENNIKSIGCIEDALNKLSAYFNPDTGQMSDRMRALLGDRSLVYEPKIDHLKWMVGRKTNRNEKVTELGGMVKVLMATISDTVIDNKSDRVGSAFRNQVLYDLNDVNDLLLKARFTSFRQQ